MSSSDLSGASLRATRANIEHIEGWLRPAQADLLWELAEAVPSGGTVVEIGSSQGKSTIVLGRAAPHDARIFAIDPHAGNDRGPGEWEGAAEDGQADHEAFLANLDAAGVGDRITHVREFSQLALDSVEGEIDFLYVDGAHGYEPARADIVDWGSRVKPSGTMAIHDVYTSLYVTLAVMATLWWSGSWRYVGRTRSMAVFQRAELSSLQRITNLARQVLNLPWFVKNLVVRSLRRMGATRLAALGEAGDGGVY
jgi:predicted O-methyltransferase YrrM